jgi:DNA modification methylase
MVAEADDSQITSDKAILSSVLLPGHFVNIINGDCRTVLKELAPESIQCCVTSPPYWGLRDYGHADQIGQEPTPLAYVEAMVAVFAEVWRVLRADGTVWLNLGDSYSGSWGNYCAPTSTSAKAQDKRRKDRYGTFKPPSADRNGANGLKSKDLCMIPARVALALQAAGWYLRSEITWCKKSCMPESVTDRPTVATEKIYLLAKSERYYYDAVAVKQKAGDWGTRDRTNGKYHNEGTGLQPHSGLEKNYDMANLRNYWLLGPEPCRDAHFAVYPSEIPRRAILAGSKPGDVILDPFGGSGTTGKVALELGRRAVLVELNPEYAKLCEQRCTTTRGLPLAG